MYDLNILEFQLPLNILVLNEFRFRINLPGIKFLIDREKYYNNNVSMDVKFINIEY